jgi:hypothetical protein
LFHGLALTPDIACTGSLIALSHAVGKRIYAPTSTEFRSRRKGESSVIEIVLFMIIFIAFFTLVAQSQT